MQDNLEVIQWFYGYCGGTPAGDDLGRGLRPKTAPQHHAPGACGTDGLLKQLAAKDGRISDPQETARVFENERDFYFEKLVLVERLLAETKTFNEDCRDRILGIMYRAEFVGDSSE